MFPSGYPRAGRRTARASERRREPSASMPRRRDCPRSRTGRGLRLLAPRSGSRMRDTRTRRGPGSRARNDIGRIGRSCVPCYRRSDDAIAGERGRNPSIRRPTCTPGAHRAFKARAASPDESNGERQPRPIRTPGEQPAVLRHVRVGFAHPRHAPRGGPRRDVRVRRVRRFLVRARRRSPDGGRDARTGDPVSIGSRPPDALTTLQKGPRLG